MTTSPSPPRAVAWAHKIVTAGILLTGTFFNVSAHFYGMDLVAATFFTFTGEVVLTSWFFLAFLLGLAAERWVPLDSGLARIVRRIITVYMLMLTLAHGINNLVLDNVDAYARTFSGPLYTYPAIALLGALTIFTASLPIPAAGRQSEHAA